MKAASDRREPVSVVSHWVAIVSVFQRPHRWGDKIHAIGRVVQDSGEGLRQQFFPVFSGLCPIFIAARKVGSGLSCSEYLGTRRFSMSYAWMAQSGDVLE